MEIVRVVRRDPQWFSFSFAGLCLVKHESNYRYDVTNDNSNGSKDYGIYQLNDKYWCGRGSRKYSRCWQINTYGCGVDPCTCKCYPTVHLCHRNQFGCKNMTCLINPTLTAQGLSTYEIIHITKESVILLHLIFMKWSPNGYCCYTRNSKEHWRLLYIYLLLTYL